MRWTKQELEILRAGYGRANDIAIIARTIPGHSPNAIRTMALRLGLRPRGHGQCRKLISLAVHKRRRTKRQEALSAMAAKPTKLDNAIKFLRSRGYIIWLDGERYRVDNIRLSAHALMRKATEVRKRLADLSA